MPLIETNRGEMWAAIHSRKQTKPSAVFIHGAGGSHLSFPASLRNLQSIQPVLIDLPGHGASAGAGRKTIGDYALDVVALMDACPIDSAIIIGHSMGAAIAQRLALQHQSRVRAMVLIGSGARLPVNPALVTGIIAEPDRTISNMVRWMWSRNANAIMVEQTAKIMRATPPSVIQSDLIACDSFDVRDRLPSVTVPTLVLAGENDKMTPLSLNEELAGGIVDSELAVIPGAGHMVQLEQPELTAELIDQWLTRLSL